MPPRRRRGTPTPRFARARALLALATCSALLASCGSSGPQKPLSVRLCDAVRAAAAARLGAAVSVRVADAAPSDLECLVRGPGTRLDVVAQATAQAWVEFDTATTHQEQVYGSGGFHEPKQIPRNVYDAGGLAAWIAADNELLDTNGGPTRGGSYVTVTVTGRAPRGAARVALAAAVARSTLKLAPRGPNPG